MTESAAPTSAVAKYNKEGFGNALDAALEMGTAGLQMRTLQDVHRYGQWVVENRMAPACYTAAGQIVVAIQTGAETGLTPSHSIQALFVVPDRDGAGMKLSWMTEAMRGLVRRGYWNPWDRTVTGVFHPGTDLEEGVVHVGHAETGLKKDCTNECYGFCRSWPSVKAGVPVEARFTVGHALQAELWDSKKFNWRKFPERMLMHRATSFHLRDNYGGILMGLMSQEEAEEASIRSSPNRPKAPQIDVESTPKGDPLFSIPEIVNEETGEVVIENVGSEAIVFETAPVTEAPKEESAGPLFAQGMEAALAADQKKLEDLQASAQEHNDGKGKGVTAQHPDAIPMVDGPDVCAAHLDGPVDGCPTCDEIRMEMDIAESDRIAALTAEPKEVVVTEQSGVTEEESELTKEPVDMQVTKETPGPQTTDSFLDEPQMSDEKKDSVLEKLERKDKEKKS